ncbi:hypothetical protein [Paraburkholderia bannensis]|uniref:hypothetical protein n=1 Tax=Paraburkholderia bannensis TaxID=765414 RepID=UPI002AC31509|nr:hypothetical protein [Paraburkholderia bannensis]
MRFDWFETQSNQTIIYFAKSSKKDSHEKDFFAVAYALPLASCDQTAPYDAAQFTPGCFNSRGQTNRKNPPRRHAHAP